VALRRRWAYLAPALSGLGAVALATGAEQAGQLALTAAGGWLMGVYRFRPWCSGFQVGGEAGCPAWRGESRRSAVG
jgi:hypothetical protein